MGTPKFFDLTADDSIEAMGDVAIDESALQGAGAFVPLPTSVPFAIRYDAPDQISPPGFTTVRVGGGGVTFMLNFVAGDHPTGAFEKGVEKAAALLSAAIHNKITLNLTIGFGEVDGVRLTNGSAAGGPANGSFESYASVHAALLAHEARGDKSFSSLPDGSSIVGGGAAFSSVAVWNAELKALGYMSARAAGDDGDAGFATDIPPSLLVGVALHELTHAMGRIPVGPEPDIMEFFRYTASGKRLFTSAFGVPSYFSLDGGKSRLANYGRNSDPSDFLNDKLTARDPFDEYYGESTIQALTSLDLRQLDVLGFDVGAKSQDRYDFDGDVRSEGLMRDGSQIAGWESSGAAGGGRNNYGALASNQISVDSSELSATTSRWFG